jgi:hypothetical protein
MSDKDVVTREQIINWYRLSGMDDMLSESRIAMLADFAIFAREAARRTVSGQEARMLAYELEGVVIDVEREDGGGFDEVCLNTVKRVRNALYDASKSNSGQAEAALEQAAQCFEDMPSTDRLAPGYAAQIVRSLMTNPFAAPIPATEQEKDTK